MLKEFRMGSYLFRRLLNLIPILIGISFLSFVLINLSPSDPAEVAVRVNEVTPTEEVLAETRAKLGLDKPFLTRYVAWLNNSLHGDFGNRYVDDKPVLGEIQKALPATLVLAGAALCLTLVCSLSAGIVCALPRPLSVNVSRMQFHTPDFVERYIRIKSQYAIPDGLLELEFTESIFFDNVALLSSAVHELRRAGIKCSIDDFGAGYSSLNVLKALPVSVLKLDGMFLRTAKDDEQAKIVIRNIMRMAGELKMATVAEGVETHEQVAFLETTGCDIIQGYVFARPMPAAEFTELLAGEGGHAER